MKEKNDILKNLYKDKRTDLAKFLSKFRISEEEFKSTGYEWVELEKIKNNYLRFKKQLQPTAEDIVKRLFQAPKVHSIRFRLKDEEHLIAKIVRKTIENPKRIISIENYKDEITDLIGIRILHLYKDEWQRIHNFIKETYSLKEPPIAYIRLGDNEQQYKDLSCESKVHVNNYRSVHYIFEVNPTKVKFFAEIQVRTLFEEAWSEIDHNIRYPYNTDNIILGQYLDIFNRIAGSADEMGLFIKQLQRDYLLSEKKYHLSIFDKDEEIRKLKDEIESLSISKGQKGQLNEKIDNISLLPDVSKLALPLLKSLGIKSETDILFNSMKSPQINFKSEEE